MELKIRNVDPNAVKKIDELAKRFGVSRQVYLKETLKIFSMLEVLTNKEKYYEKQLQANTKFLHKASRKFDESVRWGERVNRRIKNFGDHNEFIFNRYCIEIPR